MGEVFDCVYYGKLSFHEAYNMPVYIRKWWINRINNVLKEQNQDNSYM